MILRQSSEGSEQLRNSIARVSSSPGQDHQDSAHVMAVSSTPDQASKKRKTPFGTNDTAGSPSKKGTPSASPASPSKDKKGKQKVVEASNGLNAAGKVASSSKPRPRPSAGSASRMDASSSSFSQDASGSNGTAEKRLPRGQKPSSGEVVIRCNAEQAIGPVLGKLIGNQSGHLLH